MKYAFALLMTLMLVPLHAVETITASRAANSQLKLVLCEPFTLPVGKRKDGYWIWDGVHPTYQGHQLMADEWERVVREFWQ